MITREEADQIAEKWVRDSAAPGTSPAPAVREFDLGYVVWAQQGPDDPPLIGAGRGIIDGSTGELSVWPSLPLDMVIEEFRRRKATRPPTLWTWDPAEQARWDLRHAATPSNVSHLRLADQVVIARSVKGDEPPHHHPLVLDFFRSGLSADYRERGYDRCSEAAALSDALHAEDATRKSVGDPPITLDDARVGLFGGTDMVTYRVRESGDPVAATTTPPCLSCAMLLRHFGFQLGLPAGIGAGGQAGRQGGQSDA